MEAIMFYPLAVLILLSAIGVVILPNPIHGALCLIVTLVSVAAMFGLLSASFLAVAQVIVYAGAIVVLVLFVLMLLNIKEENPEGSLLIKSLAALISAVILCSALIPLAGHVWNDESAQITDTFGSVQEIGQQLFSTYVFPFEAASILIMAAMVGAVMLATSKKIKLEER